MMHMGYSHPKVNRGKGGGASIFWHPKSWNISSLREELVTSAIGYITFQHINTVLGSSQCNVCKLF